MNVQWRKSAIESLLELDRWRQTVELQPIAAHLKRSIEEYFAGQNYSIYVPGRQVLIKKLPLDVRMVLVSLGKSDPYKVFYRISNRHYEIVLVRHPRQKSIYK